MATQEAKRCTGCNAPMLSAVERDLGKCTACLRKERMTTAKTIAESVTPAKEAKAKTPTTLTPNAPTVLTGVNVQPLGDTSYTELVAVRVSKQTQAKLDAYLSRTKQAKAPYLRAIIDNALGE